MALQVTAILIGVEDLALSKKFYGEGLGCEIRQDYPKFVSFNLGGDRRPWPSTPARLRSGRWCLPRGIRVPGRLVPHHR